MTLLYGTPTHIVEWLDFPMGEQPERWRHVKGPWSEAECLRYVSGRQGNLADRSASCYPDRYRIVEVSA